MLDPSQQGQPKACQIVGEVRVEVTEDLSLQYSRRALNAHMCRPFKRMAMAATETVQVRLLIFEGGGLTACLPHAGPHLKMKEKLRQQMTHRKATAHS